jgi:spore germination protein YaaH
MRRFTVTLILVALVAGLPTGPASAADPQPRNGTLGTTDGSLLVDGAAPTGGTALPPMPSDVVPSVHAEMLAEHADDVIHFRPGAAPTVSLQEGVAALGGSSSPTLERSSADDLTADGGGETVAAAGTRLPNGLRKEVFGFLPYWYLSDSMLDSMNYQLVSTIAYFSVNANRDGGLVKGTSTNPSTGWAGWKSAAMTEVTNRAHQHGVRVVLTVTMMSWDSAAANRQAALLGSSTARSRLVRQIVSAIRDRGADGVNLDFEPLASSLRDEYVSFVKQLKRGLVNAGVGDYLTVCVMGGSATWATGYDVPGLTASGAADALFVMGYDYNWSGSGRAGGVAPIQSPYTIDVAGTMADFLTQTSGRKLIWGVPYYGRTWPTETKTLNARTLGHGSKSYTYTGHLAQAAQYGRRWDDVGQVPWYRYWDGAAGNWVQGYYDDVRSLGAKYDLVNSRGLAGTGMWTLLMDSGRDELWRLLAQKFVTDGAPPVGGIRLLPPTVDAQALRVRWRATDYATGVASYSVQWRRPGGFWHSWLSKTQQTSAWFTGSAGQTYDFRFRAVDVKGNASAWTTVTAQTASLAPNSFATVSADTLNVRSGPGTAYGIVDNVVAGDVVYVLEGPASANNYEWYRVQYGFTEFPSADYPRIAWIAGSTDATEMLEPSAAPSRTTFQPFVRIGDVTDAFSPNGDGVQDVAMVSFELDGAASAVRVDVLDAAGDVVDTISLGARPAGMSTATWDGRDASGLRAPEGTYLARVAATDSHGEGHVGPTSTVSHAAREKWGIVIDRTAPAVDAAPAAGDEMVPAALRPTIAFSEPVVGLGRATVGVYDGTTKLPASVSVNPDDTALRIVPADPLPTGHQLSLRIAGVVRDAAGNRPQDVDWSFWTAPGLAYQPERDGWLVKGTRTGYDIAQDGDLLQRHRTSLSSPRGFEVAQRATLPNLPGHWLLAGSSPLSGRWLRETARQHLGGVADRTRYDVDQRIRLKPGTHVGYRFEADGSAWDSRSLRLRSPGGADASQRAIINGIAYWRLASGALDGYWVAESSVAYRHGMLDAMTFAAPPRIDVDAGRYTAYAFSTYGSKLGSSSRTFDTAVALHVSGWAVIDGIAYYQISSGDWAGLWLAESSATQLHV